MKNLKSFLCLVLVCTASLLPSIKSEEEFSILNQYKFQNTKSVEQKDHKIHLPISTLIKGVCFITVGYLFAFHRSERLSKDNTGRHLIAFGEGRGLRTGMVKKMFASPFQVLCYLVRGLMNKVSDEDAGNSAFSDYMEEKRFISGQADTKIWHYMAWTIAWPIVTILLTNLFVNFLVPSDKGVSSRGANRSFYKGNQLVNRASAGY